jgi:heparan-alpha-glucosaminide N-acetyltransferase
VPHALHQRDSDTKIGPPRNPARVDSVDVLRGLVMFLMLFVNDVASVDAAPAWMKHFHPADGDGMTFVDIVFPAFLFIVGMSVPLAFRTRVARGEGTVRITLKAIVRTTALLLLGVLMVNMDERPHARWREGLWPALVYLAAIATWVRWPPRVGVIPRLVGAVGLALLVWVFRTKDGGWLEPSWWGILGLIGWAYLVAFVAYLIFRERVAAHVGLIALLYAAYIAGDKGLFEHVRLNRWVDIGSMLGSHGAIAVAGVVLTIIVILSPAVAEGRRIMTALVFGGAMAIGAVLLDPLYGINKNAATPSWCLRASAITCWAWIALHWLIDVRGWGGGLGLLRDLGRNALLAYLLHPLFYAVLDLIGGGWYWAAGQESAALGIARSLALATIITIGVAWMYRLKIRIRL